MADLNSALAGMGEDQHEVVAEALAELERERDRLREALAGVLVSAGVPAYVRRNVEAALAGPQEGE